MTDDVIREAEGLDAEGAALKQQAAAGDREPRAATRLVDSIAVTLQQPGPGSTTEIPVETGQNYVIGFDAAAAAISRTRAASAVNPRRTCERST